LGNNDQTLAENKEQNNVEIQDTPIQAPVIVTVQDTTVSTKENEIPVFDSVKMLETTLTDESKIAGGKNEKAKVEIATSPVAVAAKENAAKDKATTGMAEAPKPAEAMTYKLDDASMDVSKKAVAREFKAESRGVNNDAESEKTIDPKKSVNLEDAMTLFNAGDYKKAAGKFDEELKVHPDNADALYFGGVSNYIAGDNGKAEKNFEKLIKKGIYADGSKWYKANVLIRKGKKEEAKNIIRELTNSSGSYKERAIKKYEELMK